ncbi:MAG: hypothetical protein ABI969_10175, partial [bacterium]
VDVSFLLDAPAGANGFVRVQGGHLAKPNGTRLRLWGVHLTDWSRGSVLLPPKEDIPMWAGTLARYGVNCVRLHFIDLDAPRGIIAAGGTDSRHLDPQQLDRLDFLVSELKKRGIYVDLNLNVGRSYKAGDGVQDFDKIRWGKGLVLYDPRLIELEKEYAKQILTHVNPYTNNEYRNEPSVAIVEILNENGLWVGFNAPTPYYDEELTTQYNAWLEKKRTPAEVQRLREITGVTADAPIPRLNGSEVGSAPKERYNAEMSFIGDVESTFYHDMAGYLKNTLGVKVPITGTADHSHSGSSYPMLSTLKQLDVMDGHVYWQHPGSPPPVNTPMVNDPLHSTIVQLSRTAMEDKPYTVSEVNHPFPNDWASEGIPILAAYGSFQDWDAIILYTFEPKKDSAWSHSAVAWHSHFVARWPAHGRFLGVRCDATAIGYQGACVVHVATEYRARDGGDRPDASAHWICKGQRHVAEESLREYRQHVCQCGAGVDGLPSAIACVADVVVCRLASNEHGFEMERRTYADVRSGWVAVVDRASHRRSCPSQSRRSDYGCDCIGARWIR